MGFRDVIKEKDKRVTSVEIGESSRIALQKGEQEGRKVICMGAVYELSVEDISKKFEEIKDLPNLEVRLTFHMGKEFKLENNNTFSEILSEEQFQAVLTGLSKLKNVVSVVFGSLNHADFNRVRDLLAYLPRWKNLEFLKFLEMYEFYSNEIQDLFTCLSKLENLKCIDLGYLLKIKESEVNFKVGLTPNFKAETKIIQSIFELLSKLKNLRFINWAEIGVANQDFFNVLLESFLKLKKIEMVSFGREVINLYRLDISKIQILFENLSNWENLRVIDLSGGEFFLLDKQRFDAVLEGLLKLKKLQSINLSEYFIDISSANLQSLFKCLSKLEVLKNLHVLNLGGIGKNIRYKEEFEALCDSLSKLKYLHSINLSDKRTDAPFNMKKVFRAFDYSEFGEENIDFKLGRKLADTLKNCSRLISIKNLNSPEVTEVLTLHYNNARDDFLNFARIMTANIYKKEDKRFNSTPLPSSVFYFILNYMNIPFSLEEKRTLLMKNRLFLEDVQVEKANSNNSFVNNNSCDNHNNNCDDVNNTSKENELKNSLIFSMGSSLDSIPLSQINSTESRLDPIVTAPVRDLCNKGLKPRFPTTFLTK